MILSRLARWTAMPLRAAQVLTGAKDFAHPVIGSAALNARGLHEWRVRTAAHMASRRRAKLAPSLALELLADFERDGFLAIRELLPPTDFAALKEQVIGYAGPVRAMVQGDTTTLRMAIDPHMLRAAPALGALTRDARFRAAMRYVASSAAEPLLYVQAIVRHAGSAPDPQTNLHSDTFHATMKSWFFLTDVAADDGAFTYVPGSHRATPERLAWQRDKALAIGDSDRLSARGSFRVTEDELAGMRLPPPHRIAAPANTLVVADTCGFHARGPSGPDLARIEVWGYARRNPFLPFTGLDLLGLPGIAPRRIGALWAVRDRLKRWLGQPWREMGTMTIVEAIAKVRDQKK